MNGKPTNPNKTSAMMQQKVDVFLSYTILYVKDKPWMAVIVFYVHIFYVFMIERHNETSGRMSSILGHIV